MDVIQTTPLIAECFVVFRSRCRYKSNAGVQCAAGHRRQTAVEVQGRGHHSGHGNGGHQSRPAIDDRQHSSPTIGPIQLHGHRQLWRGLDRLCRQSESGPISHRDLGLQR